MKLSHTTKHFSFKRQTLVRVESVFFHHLTTVGGTIYDAKSKSYGFIQGVGRTTATALTPDIDVLSDIESSNPVQVPTTTHLFAVSSKDQV